MLGSEFESYGKAILKNQLAPKCRAFPTDDKTTWCTIRWQNFKGIKARGTELSEELSITDLSLCFMEAKNIAASFN